MDEQSGPRRRRHSIGEIAIIVWAGICSAMPGGLGGIVTDKVIIDFDHHSPEYRERGMEIAAEARAKCPVAWSESHGGYWVVTGLDEASAFQKRPDVFSAFREVGNPDSIYRGISIPSNNADYGGGFLEMDPPDQLAYRRIVNQFLAPSAVLRWEPMIRELTNASIDEWRDKHGHTIVANEESEGSSDCYR